MDVLRISWLSLTVSALLLVAFMLGVFFRGFDQFYFAPGLLCISIAAFLLFDPLTRREWALPWDGASRALLCFWLWLALSILWSDVRNISMTFLHLIGAMPLLYFALTQHPDADHINRRVLWVIGTALAVIACWAVFQFAFLYDYVGDRVHHPMLNANNLAVILAMGVFVFLVLMLHAGPILRVVALIAAGLCVAGVLVTQSRGGILGLLVGLILLGVIALMGGRRIVWGRYWKFYVAAFCAVLLLLGLIIAGTMVRTDEFRILTGGMGSITERFLIWGTAWDMMLERPFFGPGLGLFYLLYPSRRPSGDTSDGFFVHWDPLQFGLETGIAAMILFYVFAVFVLALTLRALGRCRDAGGALPDRMRIMIPFAGLLSLMINAHVNFDLYMLPAQMLAALLMVQWFLACERYGVCSRISLSWSRRAMRPFLLLALTMLFVLSPLWVVRAGWSVFAVGKAMESTVARDNDGARIWLDRALTYGDPAYYRAYFIDAQWYGRYLQTHFNAITAQDRADVMAAAQGSIDRAIAENPYYSHAYNYKAILHVLSYPRMDTQGMDKAFAALHKGLELDPFNFDVRIGLAKLYDRVGQPRRALSVLEDAWQWEAVRQYGPPVFRVEILRLMEKLNDPRVESYRADLVKALEAHNIRVEGRRALDDWISGLLHHGRG